MGFYEISAIDLYVIYDSHFALKLLIVKLLDTLYKQDVLV